MKIIDTPLLSFTAKLEKRRVTGIQEFVARQGEKNVHKVYVYFYDGLIEAVSSTLQKKRLGYYLVKREKIDTGTLTRLLREGEKRNQPLGAMLVEYGIIEPPELREILVEQATDLFQFAIEEGFLPGEFSGNTAGSMEHRLSLNSGQLTLELARRRTTDLHLAPDYLINLRKELETRALGWAPEEVLTLSHIHQPITLEKLLDRTTLSKEKIMKTLQTFMDLGMLRISEPVSGNGHSLVKYEPLPLEFLIPKVQTTGFAEKVDLVSQNHSAISEQFRAIKVRLSNQVDPPVKILGVTSPVSADGKSLISANLALSFAREMGRRVLLLEADLRNPTVHERLGLPIGPGLSHYLLGDLDPQCYIRRVEDLFVMTGGHVCENAFELLSLGRMKELMAFLRKEFDMVIVDSPPLLPIADARLISGLTDASVMVVYQGKTPFRGIQRALELVDKRKLLGVILNGVKATGLDGYYSYGYYYAYPYKKSQEKEKSVISMKKRRKLSRQDRNRNNVIFK